MLHALVQQSPQLMSEFDYFLFRVARHDVLAQLTDTVFEGHARRSDVRESYNIPEMGNLFNTGKTLEQTSGCYWMELATADKALLERPN